MLEKLKCGRVPVEMSEDETAIVKEVRYLQESDELVGYCGVGSEEHKCIDDFVVKVGEGVEGYNRIVNAFNDYQIGSYAISILINSINAALPKLPIMVMTTCNCFDHKLQYHQWASVQALYDEFINPVVGPLIGFSSDEDSRRRKLFFQLMFCNQGDRFQLISVDFGCIFSAMNVFDNGEVHHNFLCDSDYIHNHKKLLNHLDHNARTL